LKQSPREWNLLCENGYVPLEADPCVFYTVALTLGVFVDDMVIAGKDTLEIAKFKESMISRFKMTDMGKLNWYLGTRITPHANGDYSMEQTKYLEQKLDQYKIPRAAATFGPKLC
jgi:hypothetical protein